uniref:Arginine biosynthesis bifunctional protein ArgJ n=1 Tax=uncultured Nocardioidaceae bacterium TaxID=253824 RepID=A0A6J4MH31_9ACTN|nr:MAG: Glutamate N-acetyltransferase @ N-acetylglutamate synthase [uncultured Nocardioidaceae bacterium]
MSVTAPLGFRASAATAGLKASGAPDMAVIVNDGPRSAAAGVFTANRCKANPVLWSARALAGGTARAVVVNSGGANCYTGAAGFAATHRTAEAVAGALGIGAVDVQVASTGLIGLLNDAEVLASGARAAVGALSEDGGPDAARAIMTTDSVPKLAAITADGFTVGGIAKGAGMLAPALATMLVFLTTDADVDAATLDVALRAATAVTFDRLDSDGCMSTNDTVLLMASGASGVTPQRSALFLAVRAVCHDLAMQLMRDAEGSDHDITIEVHNAATEDDAVEAARSVARSNLFKCAIFGRDPNWGRVLAALGTTSAAFDPHDLDVALNDVWVCRSSAPAEDASTIDLTGRDVHVLIDLKAGDAQARVWTNDLTHAYVHENSAYSS